MRSHSPSNTDYNPELGLRWLEDRLVSHRWSQSWAKLSDCDASSYPFASVACLVPSYKSGPAQCFLATVAWNLQPEALGCCHLESILEVESQFCNKVVLNWIECCRPVIQFPRISCSRGSFAVASSPVYLTLIHENPHANGLMRWFVQQLVNEKTRQGHSPTNNSQNP